jgi:tetratricopeptide (TPR) repeat protein
MLKSFTYLSILCLMLCSITLFAASNTGTGMQNNDELLAQNLTDSYAREASGDYAGALQSLGTVRRGAAQEYLLHLRSGWLHYCLGSYKDAVNSYQQACQRSPLAIEPRLGLILPLMAQGAWDEVERQARLILRTDAQHVTANRWLCESQLALNHARDANEIAERFNERYPADATWTELVARTRNAKKDRPGAREAYQKLLLLSPGNARALAALAE